MAERGKRAVEKFQSGNGGGWKGIWKGKTWFHNKSGVWEGYV